MWKKLHEIKDPFNDAVNYRSRGEKEFFNRIFLKTSDIDKIINPLTFYIMGEKGAGKTAYATYFENNKPEKIKSKIITLTETQYKRFIALKINGKLDYSDYSNIWRSILLSITCQVIIEKSENIFSKLSGKFSEVEAALKKWNRSSLNPEIDSAIHALNSITIEGKASYGVLEASSEGKRENSTSSTEIKHHIFENETTLKEAIASLSLTHDHIVFIDGIDFRPASISYREYLDCIKGLGEASWQLNTEFFNNIRDSRGRIKIVLLVRPDVFHNLNLYNSNSRIQDNTAYLSWHTTEQESQSSQLFEISSKYLSSQQDFKTTPLEAWMQYFQDETGSITAFKKLLRLSFHKPRDILTFIKIIRSIHLKKNLGSQIHFNTQIIQDPNFTKEASDYLLGEVRNYAAFYMTPEDFSCYIKFFQYLNGMSTFGFSDFQLAHKNFILWAKGEDIRNKNFLRDAEALLQFFYDVNVIGYKETINDSSENFYHWSFKERSLNNIAPKVKTASTLMINPGIAKALDIGKKFKGTQVQTEIRQAKKKHKKRNTLNPANRNSQNNQE